MKRFVFIFLLLNVFFVNNEVNVKADEIYYTNPNGVSMTEDQYNFFGEMYWDGYQEYVTTSEYNKFLTYGYFNSTIEKEVYDEEGNATPISLIPSYSTQGFIHETTAKKLAISKACGSWYCGVTITLHWKGTPNIKSYDVIGSLLYGTFNLQTEPLTMLAYSGGTKYYGDEYYVGGGFGTSVKLQNSSTNMHISQSYDVSGTGVIYASYQHATHNITKATSQLYTVALGGYGGVFYFYGAAVGVYDQMGGVDMVVNI